MHGDGTASRVTERWLDPVAHGLALAPVDAIRGGDAPQQRVASRREVLPGTPGPVRDVVVLNAAAALVAADQRCTTDRRRGSRSPRESLDVGPCSRVLDRVVALSATS